LTGIDPAFEALKTSTADAQTARPSILEEEKKEFVD
jgi:hypothetical protein